MLAAQYLNSSLQTAYGPGGSLYDEDAVRAYAQEQGYARVYVLTLTGENAETMAADLLERWQTAEDKAAEYAAMCEELQDVYKRQAIRSWVMPMRLRHSPSPFFTAMRGHATSTLGMEASYSVSVSYTHLIQVTFLLFSGSHREDIPTTVISAS